MKECTWCNDKGFIRKSFSINELSILEWSFVLGSFLFVIGFIHFFGQSQGMISLILIIGLVVLIPTLQLFFWIFGALGLITKKKACPHCKNDNATI